MPNEKSTFIPVDEVMTLFSDYDCNSYLKIGWVLLGVFQTSSDDGFGNMEMGHSYVIGKKNKKE